jgi:hypothetical protein
VNCAYVEIGKALWIAASNAQGEEYFGLVLVATAGETGHYFGGSGSGIQWVTQYTASPRESNHPSSPSITHHSAIPIAE